MFSNLMWLVAAVLDSIDTEHSHLCQKFCRMALLQKVESTAPFCIFQEITSFLSLNFVGVA